MDKSAKDNNSQIAIMDEKELIEYLQEPSDKTHLIISESRIAIRAFCFYIEYTWFPPQTPANELFGFIIHQWQNMLWWIISVPNNKISAIKNIANILGLRIGNGVPIVLGVNKDTPGAKPAPGMSKIYMVHFPGGALPDGTDNMNVFTIENITIPTKLSISEIKQREANINVLIQRNKIFTPKQIADYIYGRVDSPEWKK